MMNKYKNTKTKVDNIVFDSKKEALRYQQLKLLLKVGKITRLELQPVFKLEVNGQKICTYKADFRYFEKNILGEWSPVVEDVKGMKTQVYNMKKKLMKALLSITIKET